MSRFFIFTLFVLVLFAKGFADSNEGYYKYSGNSACFSPSCSLEIAAEWLYMLPAYDQPYFSIRNGSGGGTLPTFFDGERLANTQTWHSGYRLELTYYLPNKVDHVRLRGTYFPKFNDRRSNDVSSAAILNFPIGGAIDAAAFSSITDSFRYLYAELLFGRPIYCYRPVIFYLEVGLQFTRLDFNESVKYISLIPPSLSAEVDYQSRLKGIGPEFSFDFAYGIISCLTINGRATAALLISKRDARAEQKNLAGVTTAATRNGSYWRTSPVVDFRLGLNYHRSLNFSCKKVNLTFEIGYEVIHFFKSADRIYFVDDMNNGSSFDQNMDFTLHGPYVHLGLCF